MDVSKDVLKDYIYDKVSEIEDEKVLKAIKILVDNLHKPEDHTSTHPRDLNAYIREWSKNMN